jgi:acyl-CoA reductase-like NAD-dependent aldehyde dehydrogenase
LLPQLAFNKENRHLDTFLRTHFKVLDQEAFAISPTPVATAGSEALADRCLVVDQTGSPATAKHALTSPSSHMTVACVDRSADMAVAVDAICTARFAFGGASPYAPDLVLVNEWVWQPFIAGCLERVSQEAARASSAPDQKRLQNGTAAPEQSRAKVLFSSNGLELVDVRQR